MRRPSLNPPFLVTRAVERKAQEIDGFWTFTPSLARVPLGKATEFDELGLARLQGKAKLSRPFAEGIVNAERIRAILEAQHEIIDIAHQVGFTAQTRPDHAREPQVEPIVQAESAQQHADRPPLGVSPLRSDGSPRPPRYRLLASAVSGW